MLLKFLNTNQPSVLFLLPVFTAAVWFPFYYEPIVGEAHPPLAVIAAFQTDLLLDGIAGLINAACLCMVTAILFNRIVNDSNLGNKSSYIYAFTYVMIEAILRHNGFFYTWQLSILFVLAGLWSLLQIYNQRQVIDLGFEAGLASGIAALFYLPAGMFFLIIHVFLQVLRPFNWREWLFPFIGAGLVLVFYLVVRFFMHLPMVTQGPDIEPFNFEAYFYSEPLLFIVLGVLLIFGINLYLKNSARAVMHARKQRLVFMSLFLFSTATVTLLNFSGWVYIDYVLIGFTIALFTGQYFNQGRFKWLNELFFLGLLTLQVTRFMF